MYAASLSVLNGGFEEDVNRDQIPDAWRRLSLSSIYHQDLAPPQTRSGTGAAEVCSYALSQSFAFVPDRYFAVKSYARGDEGNEEALVGLRFASESGSSKLSVARRVVHASEYRALITCERAPHDCEGAQIEIGSLGAGWVWHDDVALFSEEVANPSFDSDDDADGTPDQWLLYGDPLVADAGIGDSTAVRLSSEAFVTQEAAVCTDYDYLWTFRLRGDTGGESAVLTVEWFGSEGESMRIDSATRTVGTDWGLYSIQARAPRSDRSLRPAVLLRVTALSSSASEYVWLEHVYLDKFLLVSERVFPNGDGVYDQADIRLRLNEDTYVEMALKDSAGGTAAIVEPGSWYAAGPHELTGQPPPGISAATYEFEVTLEDGTGAVRTLTRPLVIDRETVFEGSPPLGQDRFVAGVYAGGTPFGTTVGELTHALASEAALLGANTVLMGTLTGERESLLELAESVGIDVVLFMQIAYGRVVLMASERGLDPTEFEELITPYVERIRDYPSLLAYYTKDEPTIELSPRVFIMNSVFGKVDSVRPSLNTLDQVTLGAQKLDLIRPPVYIYDDYPLRPNTALGDLGGFAVRIEQAGLLAEERGIPLWLTLQGFQLGIIGRYPTSAENRCMAYLSLANGADGIAYYYFGANRQTPQALSTTTVYGIVDSRLNPASNYNDVRSIFDLVHDKGDLLLDLRSAADRAYCSPPGYCTTQQDSEGGAYVWIVNTDCLDPQTVSVDLDIPVGMGYDVLANRPLSWENAGERVGVRLPPGGAALVKLGESPPSPPSSPDDLVPALGSDESYEFDLVPMPGEKPSDQYTSMVFADGLLYLCTVGSYLEVWHITTSGAVRLSNTRISIPGGIMRVSGERLVVANSTLGFDIIEVSDPTNPQLLSTFKGHGGNASACEFFGDLLFVAALNYGIRVVDAGSPEDLQIINRFPTAGLALDVRARDGLAYVADGVAGLTILDVSDPNSPGILSNLRIPGDDARQIILRDDGLVYVIGKPTVVAAVDVSDPENPVLLHTEHTFHTEKAWARGTALAVADRVAGIALLDISDPRAPFLRARARVEGFPIDVIYAGDWLFTINHEYRFHQYELRDPFVTGAGFPMWRAY